MTSLSSAGAGYRTQLLTREQADSFAQCLSKNRRFKDVQVLESTRAKNPVVRWFVSYAPASDVRALELLSGFQDDRINRAQEQYQNYLVIRSEGGAFFYVVNLLNGKTYETSAHGCSCPDYEGRCQGHALVCKHSEILDIHLVNGLVEDLRQPAELLPDVVEKTSPAGTFSAQDEDTRRRQLMELFAD